MANGDWGIPGIFKAVFGDVPAQWVRFLLLGVGLTLLYVAARDFKRDLIADNAATRKLIAEYIVANDVDKLRIEKRVDVRLRRLYDEHGWQYEDIREP